MNASTILLFYPQVSPTQMPTIISESNELFRITQVEGIYNGQKIWKRTCIFGDYSQHEASCTEYSEFVKQGYGWNNLLMPKDWVNITHMRGEPCVCMCEKSHHQSINGKCKYIISRKQAEKYMKRYGFFPATIFIMASHEPVYYIPATLMLFAYFYFFSRCGRNYITEEELEKERTKLASCVTSIILIWLGCMIF